MNDRNNSPWPSVPWSQARSYDFGLLVLRGTAVLILATWGWKSLLGSLHALGADQPLSSWSLVKMVSRAGFPFPVFFALCAALNETIIAAFLMLGVLTRLVALFAALGWAGCLYSNFLWHQELLRPAQLSLICVGLGFLGAGRYSLDRVLKPHGDAAPSWQSDWGLLVLRCGGALAVIALAIIPLMRQPGLVTFSTLPNWLIAVASVGGVLVALGLLSRWVSALLVLFWLSALTSGLLAGQGWNSFPLGAGLVGSALFAILYATLALTGPGRITLKKF